jgi:hypothetical protein
MLNANEQNYKQSRVVARFDEETHTYYDQDNKPFISTTQLLEVGGITPSYDFVDKDLLKASADKGNLIHKEIENYIKNGEIGFTKELDEFVNYLKAHKLTPVASELVVNDDLVAGTIDLVLKAENGELILADNKTTSTIHSDSVSWQCSIYKKLYEHTHEEKISRLCVFHFNKDGELNVRDLPIKSKEVIDELYEWYRTKPDTKFELSSIGQLTELYEAEKVIAYFESQKKEWEEKSNTMRESIVNVMKEKGISKFENEKIMITYIAPTIAKTLDTAKLKSEKPEIYNEYLKDTEKKEQVRIKLKGEKEND